MTSASRSPKPSSRWWRDEGEATMLATAIPERQPATTRAFAANGCVPYRCRVTERHQENDDTFTLELEPVGVRSHSPFAAGQFNMLYVFGLGEIPISISGDPDAAGPAGAHDACRGHGDARHGRAAPRRYARRARSLWHALAAGGVEGQRRRARGRRHRSGAAAARRSINCSRSAATTAESCCSTARARRRTCSSAPNWSAGGRVSTWRST